MQRNQLTGTLETLKELERLELALASFYDLCGESAANGPEFWTTLAQEERQHGETVRRMAAILTERPDRFQTNRGFHLTAVRTFIVYVESLAKRIRTGEISRSDQHYLLSLARDVEQSVLEGKWIEIVKTVDAEFQALIRTVVSATMAHKAKIAARLAVTPKRV